MKPPRSSNAGTSRRSEHLSKIVELALTSVIGLVVGAIALAMDMLKFEATRAGLGNDTNAALRLLGGIRFAALHSDASDVRPVAIDQGLLIEGRPG